MQSSHYAISYLSVLISQQGYQISDSITGGNAHVAQRIGRGCTQIAVAGASGLVTSKGTSACRVGFSKSFRGGTDDFWHFKGLDQHRQAIIT